MRVVKLESGRTQAWGVQDENRATLLTYVREWPDGVPQALFRRADGFIYNIPCEFDGHYAKIELTNTETCVAGTAKVEISWIEDDTVVKTEIFTGIIEKSLGDAMGDRPPAPMEGWVDQMAKIGAEVMEAAERAETAAISQPIIGDNGNWWMYNPETGEYEDSGKPSTSAGDETSSGEGEAIEF